jgi:MYXO-CTERM domain-containing protein
MRLLRPVALALCLASPGAGAALCDGPCSITMDFAGGGTLTPSGGATLTFGTGGALVLGTGGAISLGTGGSLDPNVDPPDMSAGGTLVLGPGGSIQFGTGGSLASGAAGGIELEEAGTLVVAGAAGFAVDSAASVHLGDLNAGGAATITADSVVDADTNSPIHVDTTGDITVTSDATVTYGSVAGASVVITVPEARSGFGDCSQGCPPGGTSTLGPPNIPTESGFLTPPNPGGGATGLWTLLAFALAGLLRRR